MSARRTSTLVAGAVLTPALILVGCASPEREASPPQQMSDGAPGRGAQLITSYGCGTCHEVPGVDSAHGLVGPPLTQMARRAYVAGVLPNTAANMERWIQEPQEVVPGNAMPDLGVSDHDAQDITACLYTLR